MIWEYKGGQDDGSKVYVLFGVFCLKRVGERSYVMYKEMLGEREVSLLCVATESKPQTHK